VLYELSREGGHVLGIDLGARRLTVALADIAGRVLAEADEPTDSRGGAWALDQIARLSDRLARDNDTHPSRLRSIVLATPGVVNPKSGAIEMAPNIAGLGHLNVVGLLGEKLGSPVVFENDINLALLGEIWHGCAQNVANVAYLALGSGVGLGLFVNGQLVRGENGAAGEIGYLPMGGDPLQAEGIPCSAGYSPLNKEPFLKETLNSRGFRHIYSEKEIRTLEERNVCPENDKLCQEAVWFTQNMLLGGKGDMEQIAEAVRKVQRQAGLLHS
jgi:hypothetical protein